LALPHALVLLVFLVLPVAAIVVVSFWEFNGFTLVPAFTFDNYTDLFRGAAYRATYLNTLKFAAIVWAITFAIGFPIAYFLAFHVRSAVIRTALFLVCTVPFLGRNGILNGTLMAIGLTDRPLDIFLYSDVSVVLAMAHLYTLYMIVPIFNTMLRIDLNLLEAARDAGASELRAIFEVVLPLSAPGIAIGTIFVVSLTLGDFMTVRLMSGGQASSVGLSIQNLITSLQYPLAAANAVILLVLTLTIVAILLRLVDIRKEL
jgi:putative spermidine/putrescine transport system permease protein